MSKGASKSGSKKMRTNNPPPMPLIRGATLSALRQRLQNAIPVVKGTLQRMDSGQKQVA